MASEINPRDEKHTSPLAAGASRGIPSPEACIITRQPESYEPQREGGLTAWLVVLSCFLLNFNLLGITYAYG